MKKLIAGVLVATLAVGAMLASAPQAVAQDAAAADQRVTQAELAKLLVRVLGLQIYLAPGAADAAYFGLLAQNGIYPAGEWNAKAPVDTAFLARMLVMALRLTEEVEDIDDPQACINVLKEHNIPIASVGTALAQIRGRHRWAETSMNTIGPQVDPILRRDQDAFNPSDEPTGGADAAGGIASQVRAIPDVITREGVLRVMAGLPFVAPTAAAVGRPVSPTNPCRM